MNAKGFNFGTKKNITKLYTAQELSDNLDNVVFAEPKEIPGISGAFRSNIAILSKDGKSYGDLLLKGERYFSYGVNANLKQGSTEITGHSVPIVMSDELNPTDEEKMVIEVINSLNEKAKNFSIDCFKILKKSKAEIQKAGFKSFYYKKDKETLEADLTKPPMLYPKVIEFNEKKSKTGKIIPAVIKTKFFNEEKWNNEEIQEEIEMSDLEGVRMYVTPVLKIESIYYGTSTSLQIKVHQALVKIKDEGSGKILFDRNPSVISESSLTDTLGLNDDDVESPKDKSIFSRTIGNEDSPKIKASTSRQKLAISNDNDLELNTDDEKEEEIIKPKKTVIKRKSTN